MPRKAGRAAQGDGCLRQRADGRWEGIYIAGTDPGTGKPIRRSVYAKTQSECRTKLRAATEAVANGTYSEPSKMTIGAWLDIWLEEYTGDVKEHSYAKYESVARVHIKPALGAIRLTDLKPHQIQAFYNNLYKREEKPLASKSIKDVNGVLHRALNQAVMLDYIPKNPCFGVSLPHSEPVEMHPLTQDELNAFTASIAGNEYETLFKVAVFTGMRQSEIMALTWDRINFAAGTILVDRQLIREKKKGGAFKLTSPKNSKPRKLTPAPAVIKLLQEQKRFQAARRLQAGALWNDGGFPGLVFTNVFGGHYCHNALCRNAQKCAALAGIENFVFHDLRHTYAVNSLRAGDDAKTVQYNLGHATAAFTLDRYGHYTDDMRKDSAARMEAFINGLKKL